MKVYGPYLRKDGRKHVILVSEGGSRRTVSYPKYLMELQLGRTLDPDLETVDHLDRDFTNNAMGNLRIVPRAKHAREDHLTRTRVSVQCSWCKTSFLRDPRELDHAAAQGKSGPFCSKKCAGTYGASVQSGTPVFPIQPRIPTSQRTYKLPTKH